MTPDEPSTLQAFMYEFAPLVRVAALFFVLIGGALLYRAAKLRRGRIGPAIARLVMILRPAGHAMIALGLAAVAISAPNFHNVQTGLAGGWWDPSVDGIVILTRAAAFGVVMFGTLLVWGGGKLVPADGSSSRVDLYLGRTVCGVGYALIACAVIVVAIAATKLSFSARTSVPAIEHCLKDGTGGFGCYYISLL